MRIGKRLVWRSAAVVAVLAAAGAFIAPRLDTGRFATRVRESLEAALGRRVEIQGKVRLDPFGPGFSVEKVVIYDDPAVSLEPLAYMESLEARVGFASFWTGQLQFSSLRMVNPSLNLGRHSEGRGLNVTPIVGRTAGAPVSSALPEIQVRGGRINFKVDDTKSIVYLAEVSLDVHPPSSPGRPWTFRLEGVPARTDRTAQRYGVFRARGSWRPDASNGGTVNASMELERSSLGEWIRLIHGHDIGLHGQVTARARFSGPASNIAVEGQVEISDIHRWDLLPPYWGDWPFGVRGTIDLIGQTFEATATSGSAVQVAIRASGILGKLVWGGRTAFNGVPLAGATALAHQMGLALPPELTIGGELQGVIGYSPQGGAAGMAVATGVVAEDTGRRPIRIPRAELILEGPAVRLSPALVELGPGAQVRLEAEYSWPSQVFDAVMTSTGAAIPETVAASRLVGEAPILRQCSKGVWNGLLRYQKQPESTGVWSGVFEIKDAVIAMDGLADALKLAFARVALHGPVTVVDGIRGQAGAAAFTGDYRYEPAAPRPHQIRIAAAPVEAAELERLFAPALTRDEGFLRRALRLGRTRPPEWLGSRHAEASFEIASIAIAGIPLSRARGRLRWDGTEIQVRNFSAGVEDGAVNGELSASLGGQSPRYRFKGRFRDVAWSGGEWDGAGVLETSGTGSQLMQNLHVTTDFSGRSVVMTPDSRFKTVSGAFILSMARGNPVLRLNKLQATLGDATYEGKGASTADGRLDLDLTGTERELRLTGTLSPFRLEPRP